MRIGIIFYQNSEFNDNNIKFRKGLGVHIDTPFDELPTWAIYMDYTFYIDTSLPRIVVQPYIDILKDMNCEKYDIYYLPFDNDFSKIFIEEIKRGISNISIDASINVINPSTYFNIVKNQDVDFMRITSMYGCKHKCKMCYGSNGIEPYINREYQHQLMILTVMNPRFVYFGNPSYGQSPVEEYYIDMLKDFNVTVQTRADIASRKDYKQFFDKPQIKVVEIGVESFDEAVLKYLKKGIKVKEIEAAIYNMRELGKIVVLNIMMNTPAHTDYSYVRDYKNLMYLYDRNLIHYINLAYMADYNSNLSQDREENKLAKSWNMSEDIERVELLSRKIIDLQSEMANNSSHLRLT